MYALISDVHANLAALEAVLADLDAHGVRDVFCLGDVVGYGPDVVPCTDLVMARAEWCVMGNHEEALIHGAYAFHLRAKQAIDYHREQLQPGFFSGPRVRARWDWLAGLPLRVEREPDLFVHGSPRDPTVEYLLHQEAAFGPSEKYEEVFTSFERLLFVGHTHQPGLITSDYQVRVPEQLEGVARLSDLRGLKGIVNVGSVGQPRDKDPRACYVLVDEDTIRWRRVPYDFSRTAARVQESGRLHESLGRRLLSGE